MNEKLEIMPIYMETPVTYVNAYSQNLLIENEQNNETSG
jgi:hypothetical protein